jgi:DNA-binding response OmpR family regulator
MVISPSKTERARLAALVDDEAPVLLVADAADAVALLGERPFAAPSVPAVFEEDGVEVDSDARVARWRERSITLAPLEHDLLLFLLGNVGHALTFATLHRSVWGNDHLGGRGDLQSTVKRLRRKLQFLGSPLAIEAVRGVGLRLVDGRTPGRATPA